MSVQGCFDPEGSSLGFSAIVDSIAATRLGWRWDLRGPGCAELHSALLLPLKPRVYLLELFLLDEVTLGRAETEHPVKLSFPWTLRELSLVLTGVACQAPPQTQSTQELRPAAISCVI